MGMPEQEETNSYFALFTTGTASKSSRNMLRAYTQKWQMRFFEHTYEPIRIDELQPPTAACVLG